MGELTKPEFTYTDLSKIFYASGIFKDIKSEAQALVKIFAGQEIGLTPIQSMNSVYIIDNKIGYEVKVFLAKIKSSGKYDYNVSYELDEKGVKEASVQFVKLIKGQQELIGVSSFTRTDAIRIGLINKDAYRKYPKLMMFYRAASDGIKLYCPEILNGAHLAEDYIEVNGSNTGTITIDGGNINVEEKV